MRRHDGGVIVAGLPTSRAGGSLPWRLLLVARTVRTCLAWIVDATYSPTLHPAAML